MASGQSVHDEIRAERKKLKGKGLKANLEYFWDYYKIHTIVAIFAIILLAILIRDIRNNKPYGFYAMMLNCGASEAQTAMEDEFAPIAGIDTTTYDCLIDTTSSFHTQTFDELTVATSQKIMAVMSAKELDVIAADIPTMLFYANQETFLDLRTVYSEEELQSLSDRLIYVDQAYLDYLASEEYQTYISTGEFDENNKFAVMADNYNKTLSYDEQSPDTMEQPVPIAIKLTGSQVIDKYGLYYGQECAVAVVINSQHTDVDMKYIDYLLK